MPEFDNVAIASLFDTMGDLLEISGADRFRCLSYHKAASAVRAWPEQLSVLAEEGRLTEVPGVGRKLAAAVEQVLSTGTFAEYEALTERYPATLAGVVKVPGVGAKRARLLFDALGTVSVDDLERALAEGRLAGVPGLGARTIGAIASGLETYRQHTARTLLQDALPLAERVVAALERFPPVREASVAGGVRRMEETVEDVLVLASSNDAEAVVAGVGALPFVTRVLAVSEGSTELMTTAGLRVDVRVVEPPSYGAALRQATGSGEHDLALAERAASLGLSVNERGVFRAKTDGSPGERVAGATEEEVYAALGMDVPPPETREGLGEVEAAAERTLPTLVELADIRGDLHSHTDSTDSRSSLEENRDRAAGLGYEWIAITDHAQDLRMVRGLSVDDLERQWERIDSLNDTAGPKLLKGIELNIGPGGRVDYPEGVLARFDLCVASLHSGWGEERAEMTARLLAVMDNPYVDIIGHPTGRILGRRDPIPLDMEAVLAKAGETGTVMEVNAYPDRLDLSAEHVRLARRYGVRFALGCDAHHAEQMAFMRFGVAVLRRGWAGPGEVLNCLSAESLLAALKRVR